MSDKRYRISPRLTGWARRLRAESTFPERLLWSRLRSRHFFSLKFRRQQVIAGYVVDFYCPDAMLIIEIDGLSHLGRQDADLMRAEKLNQHGFRIIRFTNDEVLYEMEAVLAVIADSVGIT